MSYPKKMYFSKTSPWSANCDKPIRICQPQNSAITIFEVISSVEISYCSSIVYSSRLAISHTKCFAFVDLSLKHNTGRYCIVFAFQTWLKASASENCKQIFVDVFVNRWYLTWQPFHMLFSFFGLNYCNVVRYFLKEECKKYMYNIYMLLSSALKSVFNILVPQTDRWILHLV